MNLKDKICIITGSANGIGEKCAFKFAEYGARLILIDQDEKITTISKILEKKYNREVRFIVGDITSKKVLNLLIWFHVSEPPAFLKFLGTPSP